MGGASEAMTSSNKKLLFLWKIEADVKTELKDFCPVALVETGELVKVPWSQASTPSRAIMSWFQAILIAERHPHFDSTFPYTGHFLD